VTANNNGYGIFVSATLTGEAAVATITNSVIYNSANAGISLSAGAGLTELAIKDSSVSISGTGISVSNATLLLSRSLFVNNDIGIALSNNGVAYSAGDNDIFQNFTPISGGNLQSNPKQ
jgi:hypothetical protein